MSVKLPVPEDYGDLLTIDRFKFLCKEGYIIDYDGIGFYTDGKTYRHEDKVTIEKISTTREDYIIWFNK